MAITYSGVSFPRNYPRGIFVRDNSGSPHVFTLDQNNLGANKIFSTTQAGVAVNIPIPGGTTNEFIFPSGGHTNCGDFLLDNYNLYIGANAGPIRKWDVSNFSAVSEVVAGGYPITAHVGSVAFGMAYDSITDTMYVSFLDSHKIGSYTRATGAFLGYIGSEGAGTTEGAPVKFNGPYYIAFNSNKLYVSDYFNGRVKVVDTTTGFLVKSWTNTNPAGIDFYNGGVFVVSETDDPVLNVYNAATGVLVETKTLTETAGTGRALRIYGDELYVGAQVTPTGRIYIYDNLPIVVPVIEEVWNNLPYSWNIFANRALFHYKQEKRQKEFYPS